MIKHNSQEYYFYKLDILGLRGGCLTLFFYINLLVGEYFGFFFHLRFFEETL